MKFIKLDIQKFGASASNSKKVYCSSYPSKYPFTFSVSFDEKSTENTDNTSTIYAKASIYSSGITFSYSNSFPLTLYWYDDNENSSGKKLATYDLKKISSKETIAIDNTFSVSHKSDGTLKGYARLVFDGAESSSTLMPPNVDIQTTNTSLTAIPRAKKVSATSGYIDESVLITLTQTASSYGVTLTWSCGSASGTIKTKTTDTSVGWTIPTSIYNQMTETQKEINVTIYATTYNGNTQVGDTQSTTLVARVNPEVNKPTATFTSLYDSNSVTSGLTGNNQVVVLNASNMYYAISATALNGAKVKSITFNGTTYTDFTQAVTITKSGTINKATTNVYSVQVTDTRDNTSIVDTRTLSKIDYIVPTISNNTLFKRNTPTDGKVNLKYEGNIFRGEFRTGTTNSIGVKYWWREKGSNDWIEGSQVLSPSFGTNSYSQELQLPEPFDYEKEYEFKISVIDSVTTSYDVIFLKQDVPRGQAVLWWAKDFVGVHGKLMVDKNATFKGWTITYGLTNNGYFGNNGNVDISGLTRIYNECIANGFYDARYEPRLLPSGSDTKEYWNSLQNGVYWNNGQYVVPNLPSGWGYVVKMGHVAQNGNYNDYNVLYFTQNVGAIYRKSGNSGSMSGWVRIDDHERGYITCGLSGNTDVTISSTWSTADLSLNQTSYTNNKFTLSNGYITIPSGVSKIRVSGQIMVMGAVGYQYAGIWHNGTEISSGYYRATNASFYGSICFAPIVIPVSQGDTIKLRYGSGASGTLTIAGQQYTKLNIEEV